MKCKDCKWIDLSRMRQEGVAPCRGIYPLVLENRTMWPTVEADQQACINFKQRLKEDLRADEDILLEYITYRKRGAGGIEKEFQEWGVERIKVAMAQLIGQGLIRKETKGAVTWWAAVKQKKKEEVKSTAPTGIYEKIRANLKPDAWTTYWQLYGAGCGTEEKLDKALKELGEKGLIKKARQKGTGFPVYRWVG